MGIQVLKLRNALGLLESVIPKKAKLEILTNVHLKDGQLIATDSTKALAIDMPEVQGDCLLPYHQVVKLLKYVPGHEEVNIERKGGKMLLTWPDGKAEYVAAPTEDYPAVPQMVNLEIKQTINGEHFVVGLLSVVDYCAPEDDKRPVLQGVTVLLGDQLDVMASDGFRLATARLPVSIPAVDTVIDGVRHETRSVIIPQETVYLLGELWKKAPRNNKEAQSVVGMILPKTELDVEVDASKIKLSFGIVSLTSRRIQGTPPNYHQLVPDYPATVQLYGPDLELGLRRVQIPAKERTGLVRMVWDNGSMTLSTASQVSGDIEVKFPAQTFSPGKFAVDYAFMLEYARNKPGLITLCAKDHKSPMLLRYLNSPTVVIMPRMVVWPGDPPAEVAAVAASKDPSDEAGGEPPDEDEPSEGDGGGEPEEAETPAT